MPHDPSVDIEKARQLRRTSPKAERLLWSRLRNQKTGFKFRRQHPIEGYFANFYCPAARLAIELDGMSHEDRPDYDQHRKEVFAHQDIETIRIPNLEVLHHLDGTVDLIISAGERRTQPPEF